MNLDVVQEAADVESKCNDSAASDFNIDSDHLNSGKISENAF